MPEVSGEGFSTKGTAILESEQRPSRLLYHHGIRAEYAKFGTVFPLPNEEIDREQTRRAYNWLTREVGYVPLFLSAGYNNEALKITGYPHVHDTVFSFKDMPNGIFTDYHGWEKLLFERNAQPNREEVFHDNWKREDWIQRMKKDPGSVQVLVPSLDLTLAESIIASSPYAQWKLEDLGFNQTIVLARDRDKAPYGNT